MTEKATSTEQRDRLIPFDSAAFERGIGKHGYPELHKGARSPGAHATIDEAAADETRKESTEH